MRISSRFTKNSEAFASGFFENLKEIIHLVTDNSESGANYCKDCKNNRSFLKCYIFLYFIVSIIEHFFYHKMLYYKCYIIK